MIYLYIVDNIQAFSGITMTTPSDLNPTSPGLIPLGQIKQEPDLHTPSRRRAKLKPDLKLKVVYIYIELYCLF